MRTKNKTGIQSNLSKVAKRAYELWEKDGRHHGRDQQYWLQAEVELRSIFASAAEERRPCDWNPIAQKAMRSSKPAAAPRQNRIMARYRDDSR
jgi:hypothetical protein